MCSHCQFSTTRATSWCSLTPCTLRRVQATITICQVELSWTLGGQGCWTITSGITGVLSQAGSVAQPGSARASGHCLRAGQVSFSTCMCQHILWYWNMQTGAHHRTRGAQGNAHLQLPVSLHPLGFKTQRFEWLLSGYWGCGSVRSCWERRSGTHQTHLSTHTSRGLLSPGSAHPLPFLRWVCGTHSALHSTTFPVGFQFIISTLTWSSSAATEPKANQQPRWSQMGYKSQNHLPKTTLHCLQVFCVWVSDQGEHCSQAG